MLLLLCSAEGVASGALHVSAPLLYELREVVGPFGCEVHLLLCLRVDEAECACVQCLTRTCFEAVVDERLVCGRAFATQYLHSAVAFVAEERMADVLHVELSICRCLQFHGF